MPASPFIHRKIDRLICVFEAMCRNVHIDDNHSIKTFQIVEDHPPCSLTTSKDGAEPVMSPIAYTDHHLQATCFLVITGVTSLWLPL